MFSITIEKDVINGTIHRKAKARIGEDLFEYLLHPVIADVPKEDDSLTNSILTNTN